LPILDPIIALLVGLWVIKNAAKLFLQVNFELMDGNADNSLYQKLFSAVSSVQGVHNPHKARIRKMASLFDIDLDIEVDPAMTVYDAHEKAEQVEEAIREVIPEAYDILIHIEPLGSDSHQREEKYGLKPEDM
ncbi:MAG: cation transporter, partial [Treponema sp.]|nr:cation transporter [Treponema sp.]